MDARGGTRFSGAEPPRGTGPYSAVSRYSSRRSTRMRLRSVRPSNGRWKRPPANSEKASMAILRMVIGGQTIELDNDPRSYTAAELGAVERYTGLTVTEFGQKLADEENLSALAWSALAWIG